MRDYTVNLLKAFGLTEDDILNIAVKDMLSAAKSLRIYLTDKWNLSLEQAYKIVKNLKEELN